MELIHKKNRVINSSLDTFSRNTPPIYVYVFKNVSAYSVKAHYKDYPQIWCCQEGTYIHQTEHGIYTCKKGFCGSDSSGHCPLHTSSANKKCNSAAN